jgi:hypothetical protein
MRPHEKGKESIGRSRFQLTAGAGTGPPQPVGVVTHACGKVSGPVPQVRHSGVMDHEFEPLSLDQLAATLRLLRGGPAEPDWLARRLRHEFKDARLTSEKVAATVDAATVFVGRPDGRVCRLLDVLEGQTLTHRVTASTADRRDLWTNLSLQPLLVSAMFEPIPLDTGGELVAAEFGHDALLGPEGWLPEVPPGGLLAIGVKDGHVHVEALPHGVTASPEHEQRVRATVARHVRDEGWWSMDANPNRVAELNRAIGHALVEDPDLFRVPVSPLVELLHDVLSEHSRRHLFDDTAAWEAGEVVSFTVAGMPEYLYGELSRRANKYGMSLDRFIVATLGHAAWRTPFAEDLGPWEEWDLEGSARIASVHPLHGDPDPASTRAEARGLDAQ